MSSNQSRQGNKRISTVDILLVHLKSTNLGSINRSFRNVYFLQWWSFGIFKRSHAKLPRPVVCDEKYLKLSGRIKPTNSKFSETRISVLTLHNVLKCEVCFAPEWNARVPRHFGGKLKMQVPSVMRWTLKRKTIQNKCVLKNHLIYGNRRVYIMNFRFFAKIIVKWAHWRVGPLFKIIHVQW